MCGRTNHFYHPIPLQKFINRSDRAMGRKYPKLCWIDRWLGPHIQPYRRRGWQRGGNSGPDFGSVIDDCRALFIQPQRHTLQSLRDTTRLIFQVVSSDQSAIQQTPSLLSITIVESIGGGGRRHELQIANFATCRDTRRIMKTA